MPVSFQPFSLRVLLVSLFAVSGSISLAGAANSPAGKPNIIFILTDLSLIHI